MRADMLQVYKLLNDIDLPSTNDQLKTVHCNRTRGHNLKLTKQLSNTELRRNSFSIRVVNSWNNLTHEIVNAPSVNSFKKKLNSFWKHHPSKLSQHATPKVLQTVEPMQTEGSLEVTDLPVILE